MDYKEERKSDFFTSGVSLDVHSASSMINHFRLTTITVGHAGTVPTL